MSRTLTLLLASAGLALAPTLAAAQDGDPLPLGISIGDTRGVRGLRLNIRDSRLERMDGVNLTLWHPRTDGAGDIRGVALGLPSTGGRNVSGVGLGVFGVSAERRFTGIGLAGVGMGSGGEARGILVGGIGVGAGDDLRGIAVGGLGAGSGGDMRGLVLAGLGAGAGGNVRGIILGGLGAGAGGDARGVMIGGLGAGAGGNAQGIILGGLGAGAGGDVRGIIVGGLGAGAGGTLRGVAVSGIGAGAPTVHGIAVAGLMAGGTSVSGAMASGAVVRVQGSDAFLRGIAAAPVTVVQGHQQGLTLGIVNYARSLHGAQVGVVNIVRDNPRGRQVLPVLNWGTAHRP
jgi:hypothetical protein